MITSERIEKRWTKVALNIVDLNEGMGFEILEKQGSLREYLYIETFRVTVASAHDFPHSSRNFSRLFSISIYGFYRKKRLLVAHGDGFPPSLPK